MVERQVVYQVFATTAPPDYTSPGASRDFDEYSCQLSMSCAYAAVGCTPDLLCSRAQLPTLSRLACHLVMCGYHGWQLQC